GRPPARAMAEEDPVRLDQLLALPRAHLVVDGYNVTKRGYGDLDLEQQRHRLVRGLSAIAAQTGTEVTVAFDGSEDRKSTRLNSSHVKISYAVFCLKKKKHIHR